MTVVELIELLNRIEDKSMRVDSEGCDCIAPAGSVIILPDNTKTGQCRCLIAREGEDNTDHSNAIEVLTP